MIVCKAAFLMKSIAIQRNTPEHVPGHTTLFVTIEGHGDEPDHDWQVDFDLEDHTDASITVTDLNTNESTQSHVDWNMPNSAILEMTSDDGAHYDSIQFMG